MTALRIGWIGVGRMGHELVRRLLEQGSDVAVYNRTRAKAEALEPHGAAVVDRPVDLAGRDVVVTMISSSEVFEQVTLADGGVLTDPSAVPGTLVDCSTISAQASRRVGEAAAERGCDLLAAPVSGNPKVVRAGKVSVVASGPRAAYERVAGVLALFGGKVTYVGEGDSARLVKICHNLVLGTLIQSLVETTLLAERGGVSRADYLEFVNGSVLGSIFSGYKTPALVRRDYTPTFTSRLLRKDFELGLEAGRDLDVTLPVAALVHQLVTALSNSEFAEMDFAALLELGARASGMTIEGEDRDVSDGLGDGGEDEHA